jgi:hypothetical protein
VAALACVRRGTPGAARRAALNDASTIVLTAARGYVRATLTPRPPASCATPEFRQFDFFAGDWDTYDVTDPSKVVARNRVTVVLGGCALREVYEQNDGLVGESLSIYDASLRRWHQSWVTNRGGLLLLNGGLERADGPDRAGSRAGRHTLIVARHLVEGWGGRAREGGAFGGRGEDMHAGV